MASSHLEMKMAMIVSALFLLPLLAMATARPIKHSDNQNCWYALAVLTGNLTNAGTDSEVSVTLFDHRGHEVEIHDLKKYGIFGPDWPYFQKRHLDVFSVQNTTCLYTEPCRLILHIDAVGTDPDWYCTGIAVLGTVKNGTLAGHYFPVQGWLTPAQPEVIIDTCTGLRHGNAHPHAHAFFQSILIK